MVCFFFVAVCARVLHLSRCRPTLAKSAPHKKPYAGADCAWDHEIALVIDDLGFIVAHVTRAMARCQVEAISCLSGIFIIRG